MIVKKLAFLFFLLILGCSHPERQTFQEITQLEYRRNPDPAKFVPWLNAKDEVVRARAVAALGRIQDPGTIHWVANRLGDPSVRVRRAAAFAIGQFFSPAAEEPTYNAVKLEKEREVRSRLIEALGKDGTPKSFNILTDFVESNIPEYQKPAAIACGILAYRGYSPIRHAKSLVNLMQRTPDPEVRWRAAYGLFRIASPETVLPLMRALNRPEPLTRLFALKAIRLVASVLGSDSYRGKSRNPMVDAARAAIWSPGFYRQLRQVQRDSLWLVRLEAVHLMGTLKTPDLWRDIVSALADSQPHVRDAALAAVAEYQTPAAKNQLLKIGQTSNDWRTRGEALLYLAPFEPAAAYRAIRETAEQAPWPRNYYLIKALEHIPGKQAVRLLLQYARSKNPAQAGIAFEALTGREDMPVDFLLEQLKGHDPAIITMAADKAGELRLPKAVPLLLAAYRTFKAPRDAEPMEAILAALGDIKDPRAVPLLKEELGNPFPAIRDKAREALKRITGREFAVADSARLPLTRTDFPTVREDTRPKVRFRTTKGDFDIELYPQKAPVTVANFVQLVKSGFYDGIYVHRVVPGFVIQAGDPRGDGWGGPGYTIPCEYNDIFYRRGVVGMATAGKDTGGSQFFVVQAPQPHLNGRYTAFGKVSSGMGVVDRLELYDRILNAKMLGAF